MVILRTSASDLGHYVAHTHTRASVTSQYNLAGTKGLRFSGK